VVPKLQNPRKTYIYKVGHNLVPLVETIKIVRGKKDVHPPTNMVAGY
jgi:hypothetical protein